MSRIKAPKKASLETQASTDGQAKPAGGKVKAKRAPKKAGQSVEPKPAALTNYEKEQVGGIREWKDKEPSVVDKALGVALEPLAWMIRKVVPDSALLGALQMARKLSTKSIDVADVVRDAGVDSLSDLKTKDLALSDRLADDVHNRGVALALASGAGTGIFGIIGAPVDIPALITVALRTIEKIGVCYGYACSTKEDEDFIMGVLSTSGANTMQEKISSLSSLRTIEATLTRQTWKKMAEVAAKNQLGKEGAIFGLRQLAKQLSMNITKRKALAAIPFIGAAIGGSMNAWYLRDVGWAARRLFQERWLLDNGKIIGV